MLKARLKNRVLRIEDEKADEYKRLGYTILDMNNNVLYAPQDKDAQIRELRMENDRLRAENAELHRQMEASGGDTEEKARRRKKTE